MLFRDSTQAGHLLQLIPFAVPHIHIRWIRDVREDIPAQPLLHPYVSCPLNMLNLSPLNPWLQVPEHHYLSPEEALWSALNQCPTGYTERSSILVLPIRSPVFSLFTTFSVVNLIHSPSSCFSPNSRVAAFISPCKVLLHPLIILVAFLSGPSLTPLCPSQDVTSQDHSSWKGPAEVVWPHWKHRVSLDQLAEGLV